MGTTDSVDLASIKPCPSCGEPVRQFSGTPIGGSGSDLHFPGPWWCNECIQTNRKVLFKQLFEWVSRGGH